MVDKVAFGHVYLRVIAPMHRSHIYRPELVLRMSVLAAWVPKHSVSLHRKNYYNNNNNNKALLL
jgi:hypothetical protein